MEETFDWKARVLCPHSYVHRREQDSEYATRELYVSYEPPAQASNTYQERAPPMAKIGYLLSAGL